MVKVLYAASSVVCFLKWHVLLFSLTVSFWDVLCRQQCLGMKFRLSFL